MYSSNFKGNSHYNTVIITRDRYHEMIITHMPLAHVLLPQVCIYHACLYNEFCCKVLSDKGICMVMASWFKCFKFVFRC